MSPILSAILFVVIFLIIFTMLGYNNCHSPIKVVLLLIISFLLTLSIMTSLVMIFDIESSGPVGDLLRIYRMVSISILYVIIVFILSVAESVNRLACYNSKVPMSLIARLDEVMRVDDSSVTVDRKLLCDRCIRSTRVTEVSGFLNIYQDDMCSKCKQAVESDRNKATDSDSDSNKSRSEVMDKDEIHNQVVETTVNLAN